MKLSVCRWIAVVSAAILVTVLGVWSLTYPDYSDPKGLHYVLWKHNLAPIEPDRALGIMTHDVGPDRLVIGKSEADLVERFGFLTPVSEASSYIQDCYLNSEWNGKPAMLLRNSNWMVVFENGKATNLVLIKGC